MELIEEVVVPPNAGGHVEVRRGHLLDVGATSIVDLVAFNLHDLSERFDQARTKTNQGKLFISTGDVLISKLNTDMLRIVEDTYTEGTHDLEHGMCSRARWEWAVREGIAARQYLKAGTVGLEDFPDHGCFENLTAACAPFGIDQVDIPSPFNVFQTVEIDGATGSMRKTTTRPGQGTYIRMEALIDCLVAVSACPDVAAGGGGAVTLRVRAPRPGAD